MTFYLGTHEPSWLTRTDIPLFLSRRRLSRLKSLPEARGPWALDSGGFTELSLYGRWVTGPEQYADEAIRYQRTMGRMDFAAVQDWMCEPHMLKRTAATEGVVRPDMRALAARFPVAASEGRLDHLRLQELVDACPDLTPAQRADQIVRHQARTIESYRQLRKLAPGVPWAPVLQGWAVADYLRHAEMYRDAGIDLKAMPRVGVGSVCRRQASYQAYELFSALKPLGLRLHGFGLRQGFLKHAFAAGVASFDSLAWSFRARKRGSPIEGCTHATCANCLRYAIRWREALISIGKRPTQELLMLTGSAP